MLRQDLQGVPEFTLPAGFGVQWYRRGDEAVWLDIHMKADPYTQSTADFFGEQFGGDTRQLEQRQCYLVAPGGETIGTGTAWFGDPFKQGRIGRVHWIAIVPEYQGRGLSKPLLTIVCLRLRELGHESAYLTTAEARRAAIALYLRFGFEPRIRNDSEREIWQRIMESRL